MIRWLKRQIARAVAGAELAELERWRVEWSETRRWLAEFNDAADALDHLDRIAKGRHHDGLIALRDRLRRRRDAKPGSFSTSLLDLVPAGGPSHAELDRLAAIPVMGDDQIAEFKRKFREAPIVHPAPGLNRWYPARPTRVTSSLKVAPLEELDAATDWDVANRS
jgi:hypothetical protein